MKFNSPPPGRMLALLVVLLASQLLKAQPDSVYIKKRILISADSLAKGFVKKDWELFTRYSYPPLIGALGGRENFINYVKSKLGEIPDSAWKRYQPGEVLQVIKTETDLQAIVELHSVLEWMGTRITTTHYLVAESWNGGQDWTFFDSQSDRNASELIKPDLSPLLNIPPRRERMEPLDK